MKTGKEKTKLSLFETTIPSISCGYLSMYLQVFRKFRKVHTEPITVATSREKEGNGAAVGGQKGLELHLQCFSF